ncbi:MAG: HAD-IIIA family hydrolase [Candidatus Omnitrophica bacterium]|nr:HAD-IIIA family hydrolase [Candidatus Omnitrophota bacterium]MCF7894324.1 HAD-IIIA family hydrolase [Candidatus Omnitrophota bacterium]
MAKVVFLDRDGVLNQYPGDGNYVTCLKEFKLLPGTIESIKKLKKAGFKIFITSNQSGVAKGKYSKKTLRQIDRKLKFKLWLHRTSIDGIYYCIHSDQDNCLCRKPKTGLLNKAITSLKEKVELSFFIGDSFTDINTAKNFGAQSILLLSGKENLKNRKNWDFEPDYIFDNLLLASNFLLNNYA